MKHRAPDFISMATYVALFLAVSFAIFGCNNVIEAKKASLYATASKLGAGMKAVNCSCTKPPANVVMAKPAYCRSGTDYTACCNKQNRAMTCTLSPYQGKKVVKPDAKLGSSVGAGFVKVACSCTTPPSDAIATMTMSCHSGTNFASCCQMGKSSSQCTGVLTG